MGMPTAGKMWAALLTTVAVYEACAADGQLLSEGVDHARATHPAVDATVCAAIVVTALHLTRTIPPSIDPFRLLHALRS